jgi:tRNA (cytidine32/uridine32-2'-O)-methyltransferase
MGITELALVKPGRLAQPEHEMAFKLAVRAWDVLESATVYDSLEQALTGCDLVFATTARRGQKGVLGPEEAARRAVAAAARGGRVAVVFGNEKTGLSREDLALCPLRLRIPMAADQPSINLAQSAQLVAYEWFRAGLAAREANAKTGDHSESDG